MHQCTAERPRHVCNATTQLMKVCTTCGENKIDSAFHKQGGRRRDLRSHCKTCISEKSRVEFRTLREEAIDKLGGACAHCGYDTDRRILQIDHIHGGGSTDRRRTNAKKFLKEVISGIRSDLQVLCANCNWIKRFDNREHQ